MRFPFLCCLGLQVQTLAGSALFTLPGAQTSRKVWLKAFVDLNAWISFSVRLVYTTMGESRIDVAVDDIKAFRGHCPSSKSILCQPKGSRTDVISVRRDFIFALKKNIRYDLIFFFRTPTNTSKTVAK